VKGSVKEMHYYQFNIKSYTAATSHLSDDEDLAYRRLLDFYYDTEGPLPDDIDLLARRIKMNGKKDAVLSVLNEFFPVGKDGLRHNRKSDEQIHSYRGMKKGGSKGAEKRWANQDVNAPPIARASPPYAKGNANQEPRTKNHISDTSVSDSANLFPDNNQNEPKEKSNGRKKPATSRPTDWQPSIKNLELASSLGIDTERELGKFCDYHDAKGNKFADWDAAFRNWLRNASDYRARDAAREANRRQGPTSIVRAGLRAASMLGEKP